jgi:hypothetical protein
VISLAMSRLKQPRRISFDEGSATKVEIQKLEVHTILFGNSIMSCVIKGIITMWLSLLLLTELLKTNVREMFTSNCGTNFGSFNFTVTCVAEKGFHLQNSKG